MAAKMVEACRIARRILVTGQANNATIRMNKTDGVFIEVSGATVFVPSQVGDVKVKFA